MELFLIPCLVLSSLVLHVGSQVQDANICTTDGWKKMCVRQLVIALQGETVTLPCQFTYDDALVIKERKLIISRHQTQQGDVILYDSDTNYRKEEFKNRLQPIGDPKEGNGSVKISDLRLEDEGTYTFQFEYYELKWGVFWNYVSFQTKMGKGTKLQVHVRPNIRRVWKEFDKSGTPDLLKCEAEAKPEPNISWLNPQGRLVDSGDLLNHREPNGLITKISSLNIMGEEQDGVYICMVENKYAKVQKHLIVEGPQKSNNTAHSSNKSNLWFIVGGVAAAIIPLVLLLVVYKWRCRSSREGNVARAEAILQELEDDVGNTYLAPGKDRCEESEIPLYETLQIENISMLPIPPSAESETNVSQDDMPRGSGMEEVVD
uniref:CD276 antigen homolog n=1 Tax=Myxine glutinosa TaxID=7769 RepID=UPI00358EA5B9